MEAWVFETDFQWCFSLCYNVLLDTYRYSVLYNLRCLQTPCIDSFSIATITLKLQSPWVNFLTSEGQNKNSSRSAYWHAKGGLKCQYLQEFLFYLK